MVSWSLSLFLRVSTPRMIAAQLVGRFEHDPLAADLLQELGQRGIGRQIDREALQRLGDRVFRAVGDGRDLAAVEILDDHALQQVVDVVGLELHFHLGVVVDLAGVLEESDAGTEQDDPLQGQIGPLRPFGPGGGRAAHNNTAKQTRRRDMAKTPQKGGWMGDFGCHSFRDAPDQFYAFDGGGSGKVPSDMFRPFPNRDKMPVVVSALAAPPLSDYTLASRAGESR